jgi:ubiquinone/menaquinone biosynthesis C-methylase UbiE
MLITEKLNEILACPNDLGELAFRDDCFVCQTCKRKYKAEQGIIHFIRDENERPSNPKLLAEDYKKNAKDRLDLPYYWKQAEKKEKMHGKNSAVGRLVDFVVERGGIIVDLASGHGGGYIAPILKRIGEDTILIATDACLPVIENYCRLFMEAYSAQFAYFDIDLEKQLAFKDDTVDVFTGFAISNVGGGKPYSLLREVKRCLKPKGFAVFQEMLFAGNSATSKWLKEQGNLYSSLQAFCEYCVEIGLKAMDHETVFTGKGKIDPRDGMPIDEDDRWSEIVVYLEKIS